MGWYYGFKLHHLCNERGELLNFALTRANVDDRNPKVFNDLTKDLFGKLYADKGYISQYCCPVNFQTAQESSPKPFRIGLRAFFFKKQAP